MAYTTSSCPTWTVTADWGDPIRRSVLRRFIDTICRVLRFASRGAE